MIGVNFDSSFMTEMFLSDENSDTVLSVIEQSAPRTTSRNGAWDDSPGEVIVASENQCKSFLQRFFYGRESYCGGPIPDAEILSTRNVEMVMRLDLIYCIDIFYNCLDNVGYGITKEDGEWFHNIRKTIRRQRDRLANEDKERYRQLRSTMNRRQMELSNSLLNDACLLCIPKHHAGGLLLCWLNLCLGIDL